AHKKTRAAMNDLHAVYPTEFPSFGKQKNQTSCNPTFPPCRPAQKCLTRAIEIQRFFSLAAPAIELR
ncbi:MAG TPA: hypothetical protein DDW21_01445, partial [Verrucomicrobiales bacterium]|nr:hypothetical protein [Verrucomicrobiales bacterium]